jgi:shikimate kinase
VNPRQDSRGSDSAPRGPRLILIGLRCSGKTTVANMLGARTGLSVADLDQFALALLGKTSIVEAWRTVGQRVWREAEAKSLDDLLRGHSGILALGGGTPMIESAFAALRRYRQRPASRIIYLRARPETLARRIEHEAGDRPSLTGQSIAAEMEPIFAQRDARFAELAHLVIETDDLTPSEVAAIIELELAPSS